MAAELLGDHVEELVGGLADVHRARIHPALQVVEDHDRRDGDEEAEGGGDERLGDTCGDGAQTAGPGMAMAWKAVTIPMTVPRRPTKGAVEPTVARRPSPRLRLCTSRCACRSRARATDSTRRSLSDPGANLRALSPAPMTRPR